MLLISLNSIGLIGCIHSPHGQRDLRKTISVNYSSCKLHHIALSQTPFGKSMERILCTVNVHKLSSWISHQILSNQICRPYSRYPCRGWYFISKWKWFRWNQSTTDLRLNGEYSQLRFYFCLWWYAWVQSEFACRDHVNRSQCNKRYKWFA